MLSNFVNPSEFYYGISSGAPAPADVEEDLFSANMSENKARDEFIDDRLVKKTASFFYPVKKQRLKTFASLAKRGKLTVNSKEETNGRVKMGQGLLKMDYCCLPPERVELTVNSKKKQMVGSKWAKSQNSPRGGLLLFTP